MSHTYDETAADVPVRDSTLTLSRQAASSHAGAHFLLLTDCCKAEVKLACLSVRPDFLFKFIVLNGQSPTVLLPCIGLLLFVFVELQF